MKTIDERSAESVAKVLDKESFKKFEAMLLVGSELAGYKDIPTILSATLRFLVESIVCQAKTPEGAKAMGEHTGKAIVGMVNNLTDAMELSGGRSMGKQGEA
jgi:hypothetical protein